MCATYMHGTFLEEYDVFLWGTESGECFLVLHPHLLLLELLNITYFEITFKNSLKV